MGNGEQKNVLSLIRRAIPVVLPLKSPAHSSVEINLTQLMPLNILVVDDVQNNRELIQNYFAHTDHNIMMAEDGEQAIQKALSNQPDVILMDLRMPNYNGTEATKFLKKHSTTKNIPIIIVTASTHPKEEERLKKICEGFLHKPVTQTNLANGLKNLFLVQTVDFCDTCQSPITPANNIKIAPELLEILQQEKETVWQDLCQSIVTKDVLKFSQRLQQSGEQYTCQRVTEYAALITQHLEDFELDQLRHTLEQFPQLIEQLEQKKG